MIYIELGPKLIALLYRLVITVLLSRLVGTDIGYRQVVSTDRPYTGL